MHTASKHAPMHRFIRRCSAALLTLSLLAPAAVAQAPLPFDVPWVGYNAGSSAFPGNPDPYERDPYAIASADFDGDGDVDVVVANYDYAAPGGTDGSSGFAVLFNEGDGVFGEPVHYTFTTKGSFDVVVGDFDEDGHPDLALPNSGRILGEDGNTVVVFRNDGTGAFALAGEFLVGERPVTLAVGDFDSDGHLDLVADSYRFDSEHVAVLFGTGTGSFAPRVLVHVGDIPSDGLAAADFDDDGDDDLAVTVKGDLYVAMSNGNRTFATPVMISETGSQPIVGRIAAGDLDGDGHLDLVHGVYQAAPGTHAGKDVAVRFGNGDGTFAPPLYYDTRANSTTPEAVELADLDGDGDLDVATCDWSGSVGDGIGLLFNLGAGVLGGAHHVPAGQGTADLTVADVDGDGTPDVVTSDRMSMAITVHKNPGDGRLPVLASRFEALPLNIRLDAGDVDGDGDLDVFSSTESTGGPGALLRNHGDGTFAAPVSYNHDGPGSGVGRAKLRDLDGDGDLDLLYNSPHTDYLNGYHFYTAMNDGTGTFGPIVLWPLGTCGNGDVDAFDLDNDGDLDVVNLEELNCIGQNNGNRIFVSLNDGAGTFTLLPPFAISQAPRTLAGGDFDEDGIVDLATVHWAPYGFYRVLNVHLGRGDGTFEEEVVYAVGEGPMDVVAADLDGDGHLDLATANSGRDDTGRETMSVLWGAGDGAFTPAETYYAPYSPDLMGTTGIQVGDVDGDGDLDLMVTTVAGGVAMYYNDGNRGFDFAHRLGIYWRPFDPYFADFDGDAVPDLATLVSSPGGLDQLALVPGLAGAPPAAVVVTAEPVGGPVVIGPDGGSFSFRVRLTNTTDQPQTVQGWTAVTGPVDREPVFGPMTVTVPPGATVAKTLRQRVPRNAPAGTYAYHVRVGTLGGVVTASDSFVFTKEPGAVATRGEASAAEWSVSGWEAAASASATLPGGFALSEVYPNPSSGRATLTLEVAAAQAVTAEVYDVLGRRVAVLHDGVLEAGAHALVLDGAALPAGAYVVRVTGETFATTRRATLVR